MFPTTFNILLQTGRWALKLGRWALVFLAFEAGMVVVLSPVVATLVLAYLVNYWFLFLLLLGVPVAYDLLRLFVLHLDAFIEGL